MKIHQNYIAILAATGYALLVLLANVFFQAPDGMLRMGFAIALFLISRDALAGANIAKGPRSATNPARWMLAFNFSMFFGTFMLLVLWRGIEGLPSLLPAVAIGSTLFGVMLAFMSEGKPHPYAHHFQTEKPMPFGRFSLFLYYTTPPIKLALIWYFVQHSPETTAYLFFYIILIGFTFPRYQRKSGGNILWANFPTLVGYVLLVALLFAPF